MSTALYYCYFAVFFGTTTCSAVALSSTQNIKSQSKLVVILSQVTTLQALFIYLFADDEKNYELCPRIPFCMYAYCQS